MKDLETRDAGKSKSRHHCLTRAATRGVGGADLHRVERLLDSCLSGLRPV
jgi:hypothetical protein